MALASGGSSSDDEWKGLSDDPTPPITPPDEWGQLAATGTSEHGSEPAPGSDASGGWGALELAGVPDSEPQGLSVEEWPSIIIGLQDSPPQKRRRGRPKKVAAAPSTAAAPPASGVALAVPAAAPLAHRAIIESSVLSRGPRSEWLLSPGALGRLRRRQRPGELHPLAVPLQTLHGSLVAGGPEDLEARAVAAGLLGEVAAPVASLRMQAERAGSTERRFAPRAQTAVASAFVCSRAARWELEQGLARPKVGLSCVLYLDYARYDETPMRVRAAGGSTMIAGGFWSGGWLCFRWGNATGTAHQT